MSSKSSLKKMALEIVSIVIAVLLALGVSEWQEDRQNEEYASIALRNVMAEMDSNQTTLTQLFDYNKSVVLKVQEGADPAKLKSISPSDELRSVAWNALNVSGLSNHLDFAVLMNLSRVYVKQEAYTQAGIRFSDATLSMTAMANVDAKDISPSAFRSQFLPFYHSLLARENDLLNAYNVALGKCNPNYPKRPGFECIKFGEYPGIDDPRRPRN